MAEELTEERKEAVMSQDSRDSADEREPEEVAYVER